ncbi:MAG: serine hydrolase domain-containing protein [Aestuariibacter sp.]
MFFCVVIVACSDSDAVNSGTIINEEVTELLTKSPIRAVSVVFVADGSVETYHFGEFLDGTKPTDDSLYDIGSITKTYTGLVLAQAVTDGIIKLDAPISDYLPQLSQKAIKFNATEITIRDLATHLSGLPTDLACYDPNMHPAARLDCFLQHDDNDLLKRLNDYTLNETPGSHYRYSNVGVRILGIILQQLYDKPLVQLFDSVVFQHTGQSDTHAHLATQDHARWHRGEHANGIPTPDASSYFNSAGGLKSTVSDMGKYLKFYLQEDNFLADTALTILAGERDGLGRAYIWNTFQLDTEGQYYHGGGTFGTSSWVSLYPSEKMAIYIVTPYVSESMQAELNVVANRFMQRYRQTKR